MAKLNKDNVEATLNRLLEIIQRGPKEDRQYVLDQLDSMLDAMLMDDFFGTEGQLDPRGDHRDEF